ncbi:cation channel sperm-associated protein 1 [Mirounga leonina]|uniref:cation channel sperm-associated protein 1 n=1 Tax=Mirounga leonina TaxID=9715 RepID=UPI00156C0E33|nr:cation channel sperm-associated protein 1 [Mirounga leonina]
MGTITTVCPSTMVSPTIMTYPTIMAGPTIMEHPIITVSPTIMVDLTTLMNSKTFMTMPPPTIPPTPTILPTPITPTTPITMVRPTNLVEPTISHPLPWLLLIALSSPIILLVRAPLMVSTTMVVEDIMVGPTTTVSHHSGLHHQGEPYYHKDSYTYGGPHHHSEAHHHGRHHHHEAHHHRGPLHHGEPSSHHEHHHGHHSKHHHGHHSEHHHREHHHGEHHHSVHRYDYLHGDHRYREYHHGSSQVFGSHKSHSVARASFGSSFSHSVALQPSMVQAQRSAFSLTRSHSAVRSHASQGSSKVHPQDSSSKTSSESWVEEDEQFQKRKTTRAQRAHKRLHTVDLFYRLWEKLSYLIKGLRRMLRKLTQSLPFETFIFLVVCLNTTMLVAQTFAEVEIRGEWFFMALDSIFLCIYVVEAALKITALGFKYFSDSWNDLDFFIMIMAMLDFMLLQYNSSSFVYHQSVFRIFKVFKSLRALRAIRVLRRLSFLTSLQEVTGTLARSLPSITAILILMFTCLFLFSVVLRALFRHSDPKRFRSILSTIFTLFTMLTLDDWSLIYLDSRAQGAWYIIPILMIYIIIQYFIFLNLVIAVLVDNFQMALLKGLEKVKQERAARIHEKLLDDPLTELSKSDPEEVVSEHTKQKQLIEKKFGTMTEKQRELLFHFLQLVAGVEHHQQKFRSQASVLDEIVDAAFEAGEEDFRK